MAFAPLTAHMFGRFGKRRVMVVQLDGSILWFDVFGKKAARAIAKQHHCKCWNF